jgi:hypothetical protein
MRVPFADDRVGGAGFWPNNANSGPDAEESRSAQRALRRS